MTWCNNPTPLAAVSSTATAIFSDPNTRGCTDHHLPFHVAITYPPKIRSKKRWPNSTLLSSTLQGIHNGDLEENKNSDERRRRERNKVAQNRQNESRFGWWNNERFQKDFSAIHQQWEAKEDGEDKLGNASILPWQQ
ncbi:hypothetical protein V6N13_015513 [Hibiscus sabdariffa]|uniref:Uncharacterized protein n=1 Tax=Hibiscus sabdariffa TaxID=183260 RepID=A0ABR2CVW0_9ROSI